MDAKERLQLAQVKVNEAKALFTKDVISAEDRERGEALMKEAAQYKADAERLITIDQEGGTLIERQKSASELASETEQKNKSAPELKEWHQFLAAVYAAQKTQRKDPRLTWFSEDPTSANTKDMSGATGTGGGFLIPPDFRAQLLSAMAENAIVRPRASVMPMASRTLEMPALDQTQSLDAGRPRWFGGLSFEWIGEGEAKPASDAKFRQIMLVAKKLVGFTRASDELLADSAIGLAAFLSGPLGFAGGVAWMEDYAFLHGTGVAQPLGVLDSPALLTVKRDVAGKILYKDLVRMYAAHMITANSVWLISQTALVDMLTMEDSEGHLIWGNAINGEPPRILGIPYLVTEKLPAHGTTGDVLLADFNYYLVGDRQATTIDSTQFEAWQYDKTSWRVVHRVDGQPWINSPFTLQDAVTQISPFVALSSDVS